MGKKYALGDGVPVDADKAFVLIGRAAEQGVLEAQIEMGLNYYSGRHCASDKNKALVWFLKAAEQGSATAQSLAGGMYLYGEGTAKNPAEAFKWSLQAAEQGHVSGQLYLAICYHQGIGVSRDYGKAFSLFLKAADQGDAASQYWIAIMYYNGEGVSTDRDKALDWMKKAAANGDKDAEEKLRDLLSEENEKMQQQRLLTLKRDAAAIAEAYVRQLLEDGVLRKASLVGYQKGLGAELIAIFQCEYISQGGFLNIRQMSAAMSRDRDGNWRVVDFSAGGVFGGLPLESDWHRATGGGQTPLNRVLREQGY
jgi:hypothetical protein